MTVSRLTSIAAGCGVVLSCAGHEPATPTGARLSVAVAPLALPDLSDACYDLTVTNGAAGGGDGVWSKQAVCADEYGDGVGDITYVGTCDASGGGAAGRVNSVILSIADLWTSGNHTSAPGGYLDRATYQNPCGSAANTDGFGPCVREIRCHENEDARVAFDITVLRGATQGFFDVAVAFEDVFCSAKFDCGPVGAPKDILFAADGERHDTAVLAFACTAGPGAPATHLYMQDIVIACNGVTVATLDPSVDDPGRPGPGNQRAPAGTVADADSVQARPARSDTSKPRATFQYALSNAGVAPAPRDSVPW